jgi:hypothetical protein
MSVRHVNKLENFLGALMHTHICVYQDSVGFTYSRRRRNIYRNDCGRRVKISGRTSRTQAPQYNPQLTWKASVRCVWAAGVPS